MISLELTDRDIYVQEQKEATEHVNLVTRSPTRALIYVASGYEPLHCDVRSTLSALYTFPGSSCSWSTRFTFILCSVI